MEFIVLPLTASARISWRFSTSQNTCSKWIYWISIPTLSTIKVYSVNDLVISDFWEPTGMWVTLLWWSLKWLYLLICVMPMATLPKTFWIFQMICTRVSLNLMYLTLVVVSLFHRKKLKSNDSIVPHKTEPSTSLLLCAFKLALDSFKIPFIKLFVKL